MLEDQAPIIYETFGQNKKVPNNTIIGSVHEIGTLEYVNIHYIQQNIMHSKEFAGNQENIKIESHSFCHII